MRRYLPTLLEEREGVKYFYSELISKVQQREVSMSSTPTHSYSILPTTTTKSSASAESTHDSSTTPFSQKLKEVIISGEDGALGNAIASADVNGDGILDLLVGNSELSQVYVVYGNTKLTEDFDLEAMKREEGFVIYGSSSNEHYTGVSLSTLGDFNGDGIEDIIVGDVYLYDPGRAYVILGKRDLRNDIYLHDQGDDFLTIIGTSRSDDTGISVSYADINGDGLSDAVIGASGKDSEDMTGSVYVVFGHEITKNHINLESLDGKNGFVVTGFDAGARAGSSVSYAGDFNNDSIDDIIVGAPHDWGTGKVYIITGRHNFEKEISAKEEIIINADAQNSRIGDSVSYAGDVNGDGINDVIMGAPDFAIDSIYGQAYVVFGTKTPESISVRDLNGSNGFVINGFGEFGSSVSSAGDFNADGFGDIMVGAPQVNFNVHIPGGLGAFYVVYGKSKFNSILNISNLNEENGFSIDGKNSGDGLGASLSHIVNFGGYSDVTLVAGARGSGQIGNYGHVYLISDLVPPKYSTSSTTTHSSTTEPATHSETTITFHDSSTTTSAGPVHPEPGEGSETHLAAIIGGTVAGVALLAVVGGAVWYAKSHGIIGATSSANYELVPQDDA